MDTLQDYNKRKVCERKLFEVGKMITDDIVKGDVGHKKKRYGMFSMSRKEWDYVFSDYPDILNMDRKKEERNK